MLLDPLALTVMPQQQQQSQIYLRERVGTFTRIGLSERELFQ